MQGLGARQLGLQHIHGLWGNDVLLETVVDDKKLLLTYDADGFSAKAA